MPSRMCGGQRTILWSTSPSHSKVEKSIPPLKASRHPVRDLQTFTTVLPPTEASPQPGAFLNVLPLK